VPTAIKICIKIARRCQGAPKGRFDEGGSIRRLLRGHRLRLGRWRVHGAAADGHAGSDAAARRCADTKPPVALTITCSELKALFKAGDKGTAGTALLWLDGYYAGRSGLSELPAGWARTVRQGVGGTCAISVNERRTVLDVVGQLHREYGSQK
jgi:hypothetical protein